MKLNSSKRKIEKERPLDKDPSKEVGNKEIKIAITPLNPMVFYPVFTHITEKIFDQLEEGSLRNCREVSKSWLEVIDNRNLLWNKIVKAEGANEAFQFACIIGHTKMLEMLFHKPAKFNIDYNAGEHGFNAFYHACHSGQSKVAEMLILKSNELNIQLDNDSFHMASSVPFVLC